MKCEKKFLKMKTVVEMCCIKFIKNILKSWQDTNITFICNVDYLEMTVCFHLRIGFWTAASDNLM